MSKPDKTLQQSDGCSGGIATVSLSLELVVVGEDSGEGGREGRREGRREGEREGGRESKKKADICSSGTC